MGELSPLFKRGKRALVPTGMVPFYLAKKGWSETAAGDEPAAVEDPAPVDPPADPVVVDPVPVDDELTEDPLKDAGLFRG